MNLTTLQESSGKPLISNIINGSSSPNGRIIFFDRESLRPKSYSWRVLVASPSNKILDYVKPTISPESLNKIKIYSPGKISLGKTAELCGLFFEEMVEEIKSRGLHFDFGPSAVSEAEEELMLIRKHIRKAPQ
jgi:predicted HTH domain antitoxin